MTIPNVSEGSFHVSINGGSEQLISTRTGLYTWAVVAALAMLEYPEKSKDQKHDHVKIWVPNLIPEYGPYYYEVSQYGEIYHSQPLGD